MGVQTKNLTYGMYGSTFEYKFIANIANICITILRSVTRTKIFALNFCRMNQFITKISNNFKLYSNNNLTRTLEVFKYAVQVQRLTHS